jgi:uncharacterized protein (DUF1697 family)
MPGKNLNDAKLTSSKPGAAARYFVAFLRGINVGGKNKLTMADLVGALETLGFSEVKTYIQSGNIVFRTNSEGSGDLPISQEDRLAAIITGLISSRFQFRPLVVVLERDDLLAAIDLAHRKSLPGTEGDGRDLHLFFLEKAPADFEASKLDAIKQKDEVWLLNDRVIYLYSPGGFHLSKLASRLEKLVGVAATARNWRTVNKIAEMLD